MDARARGGRNLCRDTHGIGEMDGAGMASMVSSSQLAKGELVSRRPGREGALFGAYLGDREDPHQTC